MIAKISTVLPASAERVWQLLRKKDTFLHITRGMMGFSNPETFPKELSEDSVIRTQLRFFHVIPGWEHELRLVRVSDTEKRIFSREKGGPVRKWNHLAQVSESSGGKSLYYDEIDIDAGALTPLVWIFAHVFYRYRHRRWRGLLRGGHPF